MAPAHLLGSHPAGAIPGYKDPNGSDAAILLRDGRADAAHDMHQLFGPVVGGLVYQFTCCFKAAGRRWVSLGLWDDGAGQSGARVWFNLEAGMVGTVRLMGDGAARLQVSMTELGDGWFRCGLACQVSLSASTGMFTARIGLADADGNDTHAGDDESGVLVWAPFVQHRSSANLLSGGDAIGGKAWVLTNARARGGASGLPGDEASVLLREARKPGIHAVRQVVERCAPRRCTPHAPSPG